MSWPGVILMSELLLIMQSGFGRQCEGLLPVQWFYDYLFFLLLLIPKSIGHSQRKTPKTFLIDKRYDTKFVFPFWRKVSSIASVSQRSALNGSECKSTAYPKTEQQLSVDEDV